jgi:hypothetical protein
MQPPHETPKCFIAERAAVRFALATSLNSTRNPSSAEMGLPTSNESSRIELLNPSDTELMTNSANHEDALIRAFIPPHRQERFLEIIAKPKKRAKLLTQLYHFDDLNPKFMVAIPPSQQNPSSLVKLLRAKGAGSKCYVMSTNSRLDGQEVDLEAALKETVGSQEGTLISCVPGRLGYFEDEDGRCILERVR